MDNGISIAITPVQLAAVVSDYTVTESDGMSNRLWGSLELIMGAVEMAGAAALCVAPEPTGLTKAGCVVVGAHSMDTIKTAADRIITRQDTRSATLRTVAEVAKKFGADEKTAFNIGLAVDVAVPLGFAAAIGAVRVVSVRAGRIRLAEHEASLRGATGGHSIMNHVSIPKSQLAQRLENTKALRYPPPAVGSFKNLSTAESAVSAALRQNKEWIKVWAASNPAHNLNMTYDTGKVIGSSLQRESGKLVDATKVRVILRYETFNNKPFYVLTSYPLK